MQHFLDLMLALKNTYLFIMELSRINWNYFFKFEFILTRAIEKLIDNWTVIIPHIKICINNTKMKGRGDSKRESIQINVYSGNANVRKKRETKGLHSFNKYTMSRSKTFSLCLSSLFVS